MRKTIFTISFFFLLIFELLSQGLTLNGKLYEVDTLNHHYPIGPGISYSSYNISSFPLRFYLIEIDLSNPYVQIETCLGGGRAVATERPSSMSKRKTAPGHQVVAATNGDFYFYKDPIETGIPRSGQFTNRECVTNPTGWASFVLDNNKKPYVDRITFSGKISKGENSTRLHTLNMQRLEAESAAINSNLLSLYSNSYGSTTSDIKEGVKVIISPKDTTDFFFSANREIRAVVDTIYDNTGRSTIPEKKAVLHGRGQSATYLNSLAKGDELTILLETKLQSNLDFPLNLKELMGGSNNMLLRDGVVLDEDGGSWGAHPRTGLGCSQDSTKVYSIVVDGRQGASKGVTLKVFGEIFRAAGAWHAMNMDGGGSSVMVVNDEIVSKPSDPGGERAVGNGVLFISEAPEDSVVSRIEFESNPFLLPICAKFRPVVMAYNQYGALIDKNVENFSLACSEGIGFVDDSGTFVAAVLPGVGTLSASYKGIEVTKKITISSSEIRFVLDSMIIDNRKQHSIDIEGKIGDKVFVLSPELFLWEIKDESVCSEEKGLLMGLKNGTTQLIGSLNDFKDSLFVCVQISDGPQEIADDFSPSTWSLKATSNLKAVLNTDNLPSNWERGAVVNYVYKQGRLPDIKLSKKMQFYGRPDAVKIILNVGDIEFDKINLSLRANNYSKPFYKNFDGVEKNVDTELVFPVDELFNSLGQGIYPISFNFLQFYLSPQVPDKAYSLALKEILLCYKGVNVGLINPKEESSVAVFPNPVYNGELNVLCDAAVDKIEVKIYDLLGKMIKSSRLLPSEGKGKLQISELHKGSYLMQISMDGKTESLKIIIQ